jgi:hypothetical protein
MQKNKLASIFNRYKCVHKSEATLKLKINKNSQFKNVILITFCLGLERVCV